VIKLIGVQSLTCRKIAAVAINNFTDNILFALCFEYWTVKLSSEFLKYE
jgi:hypothetical protein